MKRIQWMGIDDIVEPGEFVEGIDSGDNDVVVVDTVTGVAFTGDIRGGMIGWAVATWLESPEAKEAGF